MYVCEWWGGGSSTPWWVLMIAEALSTPGEAVSNDLHLGRKIIHILAVLKISSYRENCLHFCMSNFRQ